VEFFRSEKLQVEMGETAAERVVHERKM